MTSFRNRVENIKKVNTWKQISELKKMYPDYDFEKAKIGRASCRERV